MHISVENDVSLGQVRSRMRRDVISLMLATIDHATPNLAHYMLGFELNKPISKTNLQDPGKNEIRFMRTRDIAMRLIRMCITVYCGCVKTSDMIE